MAYRRRIFFTDKQKSEIWNLWLRGESMSSIGRGFERASSSIYPLLARTGGIRPPDRTRSRLALTLGERKEISRCLIAKHSLRSIARALRRSASTISREVRRGRRHPAVSCSACRRRRLGPRASPQALQAGRECLSLPRDIGKADPKKISATNCRLAHSRASGR
ncbi:MAG: hypothetical protein ACI87T_003186 [Planctomycetota bacterium]|jgi:hypothetical protein